MIGGSAIPPTGYPALLTAGPKAVFGPGTNIPEVADLLDKLNAEMGYGPNVAAK